MLGKIGLKNFKCFKTMTNIPLKGINLFTGINGRGKSTALQALLLMRQSVESSRGTTQLTLNGQWLEQGKFNDIKNVTISQTEAVEFVFDFCETGGNGEVHYRFKADEKDDMAAYLDELRINGRFEGTDFSCTVVKKDGDDSYLLRDGGRERSVNLRNLMLPQNECRDKYLEFLYKAVEFEKIHYVSANRIGPQDFYPRQSTFEFPTVGARGEFTANILSLAKKQQWTVPESLAADTDATYTVMDQTEAWLQKIFDGGRIDITPLEANIVVMKMSSENSPPLFKPLNIGFGYSYALPIIVSGLIASKGEMLIVENPEAHLHPYAQSQLARFLARVSQNGIQVFVESHSDHVLNGLRVAVVDKIIPADDLNILYFQKGSHPEADLEIVNIPVEEDGAVNHWPAGFFDQMDKDFKRLFGV